MKGLAFWRKALKCGKIVLTLRRKESIWTSYKNSKNSNLFYFVLTGEKAENVPDHFPLVDFDNCFDSRLHVIWHGSEIRFFQNYTDNFIVLRFCMKYRDGVRSAFDRQNYRCVSVWITRFVQFEEVFEKLQYKKVKFNQQNIGEGYFYFNFEESTSVTYIIPPLPLFVIRFYLLFGAKVLIHSLIGRNYSFISPE